MSARWTILFFCVLGTVRAQNGYSRDSPINQLGYSPFGRQTEDEQVTGDEIPGEAGRDYPVYSKPPETSFSCNNQQYPGYYADPESECQAFYICKKSGKGIGFLCSNGTIFNQESLTCDWWYNFDCQQAEQYYSVNEVIAREMEAADAKSQQGGYSYNNPQNRGYQTQGFNRQISPVYGVPNRPARRPNQKYGPPRQSNRNGNGNAPRPVYGTPQNNQYSNGYRNGNNGLNVPDRTYLPPNNNGGVTSASFTNGNNGYSSPDRTYLPPSRDNFSNGYRPSAQYGTPEQNNFNQNIDRTYLPPSK